MVCFFALYGGISIATTSLYWVVYNQKSVYVAICPCIAFLGDYVFLFFFFPNNTCAAIVIKPFINQNYTGLSKLNTNEWIPSITLRARLIYWYCRSILSCEIYWEPVLDFNKQYWKERHVTVSRPTCIMPCLLSQKLYFNP